MKRRQFITSIAAVTGYAAVPAPIKGALMASLPAFASVSLQFDGAGNFIESGFFEPTITQVGNSYVGSWKRVGDVVTIEGRIELGR